MTPFVDLAAWLAAEPADAALKDVVQAIAATSAQISRVVASGALSGSLGAAG
ncbi:MAG TPA: fructose-bisphosphatase class I, partial [Caulobacter sp.]|nr:fructose-bisphosphatase class I [Caulobacter sp.]